MDRQQQQHVLAQQKKKNMKNYPVVKVLKWASAWDFQQCGMCDQQSLRSLVKILYFA